MAPAEIRNREDLEIDGSQKGHMKGWREWISDGTIIWKFAGPVVKSSVLRRSHMP